MSPEELIEYYQSEACHYMAIALAKKTGMRLGIIWETSADDDDDDDDEQEDSEDTPIHCVVTDGVSILDSHGVRPIEEVLLSYHDIPRECLEFDGHVSMDRLHQLCSDDDSCPLYAITDEHLREAQQAIATLGLLEKVQTTMKFPND